MGLCRILHNTHLSWPVSWEPVSIISQAHNFLFGITHTITFNSSSCYHLLPQSNMLLTSHTALRLANRPSAQVGWVKLCKAATLCPWTTYQCAQSLCTCLIWIWEAVWGGWQPQPRCNDIFLIPHKWPRAPKSEPSWVDNCVSLLPCAYGQHINVLKHFVYV